jgi:hypothetical protein
MCAHETSANLAFCLSIFATVISLAALAAVVVG